MSDQLTAQKFAPMATSLFEENNVIQKFNVCFPGFVTPVEKTAVAACIGLLIEIISSLLSTMAFIVHQHIHQSTLV